MGHQKKSRKWMVKDTQGLVKGPYRTRQILVRIEKKRLQGDELIAPPSTLDWQPLSHYPLFYNKLLESLNSPDQQGSKKDRAQSTRPVQISLEKRVQQSHSVDLKTQTGLQANKGRARAQDFATNQAHDSIKNPHQSSTQDPSRRPTVKASRVHTVAQHYIPKGIKKIKSVFFEHEILKPYTSYKKTSWQKRRVVAAAPPPAARQSKSPALAIGLVAVVLAGGWWLLAPTSKSLKGPVRLLHPQAFKKGAQKSASTKTLVRQLQQVQKLYTHQKQRLLQAQAKLIAILKQSSKPQLTAAAAAYLCLIDYELWPHTRPTGLDLQALDKAARLSSQLNPDSLEAKTCQAIGFMARHQWQQAEFVVDDVLDQAQHPSLASFYYLKARILAHQNQKAQAQHYLATAVQLAPHWPALQQHQKTLFQGPRKNSLQGVLQQADQLVYNKKCAQAQGVYKQLFEKNKNMIAALRGADCLWSMGLSFEATGLLQKVVLVDPHLTDAYERLVYFLAHQYDFKAAVQTLKRAYAVNKKSHLLLKAEAHLALKQQNFKGAEQKLLQASLQQPADPLLQALLSQAYLKQNKRQEAYSTALKAVELSPLFSQGQVALAQAWVALKGLDFGGDYLQKLQDQYPQQKAYPLAWGQILIQHQQYAQAREVLAQVVQRWPRDKQAPLQLAIALGKLKEWTAAQDMLWKAVALAPADARPFYEGGQLFLEARQYAKAQKNLLQALQLNPRYPLIHYSIGETYLALQQYNKALQYAQKEQQQNPRLAEPYLLAAQAYAKLSNWSSCVQQYTQAFKYIEPLTAHYIQMTRCYRRAGHLDLADKMLHIAAEKESGHPAIYKELGILRELTSEKALAVEAYNQYIDLFPNAPDRQKVERRIQSLSK